MLFFPVILLVLFIALLIYSNWRKSPEQIGKEGECIVTSVLSKLPEEYNVMNDVVLRSDNGTTQIDHIVLSRYGIFAIETKNYRGEIFGDDNRKEWTQLIVTDVTFARKWYKTYTYVTKNRFYNPVKQAYGHVYRLKDLLKDYSYLPIVPIVVFTGKVDLRGVDSQSHVICIEQLYSLILDYNTPRINVTEVQEIHQRLIRSNVRKEVSNKTHVRNIKQAELTVQNKVKSGVCPRCGGALVLRSGRYGSFYGCRNYPNCKFTHTAG